jgi:hypothetical protein
MKVKSVSISVGSVNKLIGSVSEPIESKSKPVGYISILNTPNIIKAVGTIVTKAAKASTL